MGKTIIYTCDRCTIETEDDNDMFKIGLFIYPETREARNATYIQTKDQYFRSLWCRSCLTNAKLLPAVNASIAEEEARLKDLKDSSTTLDDFVTELVHDTMEDH